MKLLVIGTGPAGFSVLNYLINEKKIKDLSITIIDKGGAPYRPKLTIGEEVNKFYDGVYKKLESKRKFTFPPPKTQFSDQIPKYFVGKKPIIFNSSVMGGLSNYWGATLLPFTENELEKWPINLSDLSKYYKKVSEIVGISGMRDGLNEYFIDDYVSNPPLKIPKQLLKLNEVIKNSSPDENYKIISGVNRCAVETNLENKNGCLYCGECMNGCVNNSIYSTYDGIKKIIQDPRVNFIKGNVLEVSEKMNVTIENNNIKSKVSGFDKIYIAAGCPNTSGIILRSTGLKKLEPMHDNSVCVFPIIYTKKLDDPGISKYISLNNIIMSLIPIKENLKYSQVLLYPNFDYLWRYNIPESIWPYFEKLFKYSRNRVFWARLYVHGNYSQSFNVSLNDDNLVFTDNDRANRKYIIQAINSIRMAVSREGFYVPKVPLVIQKSSSHYSSTIPYGSGQINLNSRGEIFPNIYLCDSTVFPNLPAVSLSFTIMANAYRTAFESMRD